MTLAAQRLSIRIPVKQQHRNHAKPTEFSSFWKDGSESS
jgi:hypothetical protein